MSAHLRVASRSLLPMACLLMALAMVAVGLVWRQALRQDELAQRQTLIAQTAAIEALRSRLDQVMAEAATRGRDAALAELINRARADKLAAATKEEKP